MCITACTVLTLTPSRPQQTACHVFITNAVTYFCENVHGILCFLACLYTRQILGYLCSHKAPSHGRFLPSERPEILQRVLLIWPPSSSSASWHAIMWFIWPNFQAPVMPWVDKATSPRPRDCPGNLTACAYNSDWKLITKPPPWAILCMCVCVRACVRACVCVKAQASPHRDAAVEEACARAAL